LASNAGVSGQEFAKLQAGNGCGDGPEGAAVLAGSGRLGVVGFEMAGTAVAPDDQERVAASIRPASLGAKAEQVREAERPQAGQAEVEELAPADGAGARGDRRTRGHLGASA